MAVFTYNKYLRQLLGQCECILARDTAADYLGLINGGQRNMVQIYVRRNLKYDKVFSVIDINYDTFRKWEGVTPFYQNVTKEGTVLWKAA